MRAARDTFLKLLADNLTGITVWNLRHDLNNPEYMRLHEDAVNVQFLDDAPNVGVGTMTVLIDILSSDELTAVDTMKSLWTLLSASGYTEQYDYSTTPPTALGSNIFWNPNEVRFRPIWSETFFRYSSTLRLRLHNY